MYSLFHKYHFKMIGVAPGHFKCSYANLEARRPFRVAHGGPAPPSPFLFWVSPVFYQVYLILIKFSWETSFYPLDVYFWYFSLLFLQYFKYEWYKILIRSLSFTIDVSKIITKIVLQNYTPPPWKKGKWFSNILELRWKIKPHFFTSFRNINHPRFSL